MGNSRSTLNIGAAQATGNNVGGQTDVFQSASNGVLNFKTLQGAGSVIITGSTDVVTISGGSTGGGADGVVSGATLNTNTLELARTEGLADVTVDLSSLVTSPAGSNREIQFNNNGSFGAESGLTYSTGGTLSVGTDFAIGNQSILRQGSGGNTSLAIGFGSDADTFTSIAIGCNAQSYGSGSIAIGRLSKAYNGCSIAIGVFAVADPVFTSALAIGTGAQAFCDSSISIGYEAGSGTGTKNTALSIGYAANRNVDIGNQSMAIGNTARSQGFASVSIGNNAQACGTYSIRIGDQGVTCAPRSVAIGRAASVCSVGANGSVAIGYNNRISGDATGTVVIGGTNRNVSNTGFTNHVVISNLAIEDTPVTNGANSNALVWNSSTCKVEINTSLGGGDGVVSGATLNSTTLELQRTEGLPDVTVDLSGLTTSPAGNDREIQFNDNGLFGTDSTLTYSTGGTLNIHNDLSISGTSFLRANGGLNSSIELGIGSTVNNNDSAIAIGAVATVNNSNGISIGALTNSGGVCSIAMGRNTQASGTSSIAIGYNVDSLNNCTIAIGAFACVPSTRSLAIGSQSFSQGNYSISIGRQACNNGTFALAIGDQAIANASNSVAIGRDAYALGGSAIAIGSLACSNNISSIAIGNTAIVSGSCSIGIGGLSLPIVDRSIAIGNCTLTSGGTNSIAIGERARIFGDSVVSSDIVVGYLACTTSANGFGYNNVVLGRGAQSDQNRNVVIGDSSRSERRQSISIGYATRNTVDYTTNIGVRNVVSGGTQSTIIGGMDNCTTASCATLIGLENADIDNTFDNFSIVRNLAICETPVTNGANSNALVWNSSTCKVEINTSLGGGGSSAYGGVNTIQLSDGSGNFTGDTSFCFKTDGSANALGLGGSGVCASSTNTIAIGGTNALADATQAVAIGTSTGARGVQSVTLGVNTCVCSGSSSGVAIGNAARSEGGAGVALGAVALAAGNCSIAIGNSSDASGTQAVAIGTLADSTNNQTVAVGNGALATASRAIAMGNSANASSSNAISIGSLAASSASGSIALGFNVDAVASFGIAIGSSANAQQDSGIAIGASSEACGCRSISIGNSNVVSGNCNTIIGGVGNSIDSTLDRAVLLGGYNANITGASLSCHTIIDNLAILSTPITSSCVSALVWDAADCRVKLNSSLGGGGGADGVVSGATLNGSAVLSLSRTEGLGDVNVDLSPLCDPAGVNTNVQFNNNGSFGGDNGFTFNSTTCGVSIGDSNTLGGSTASLSVGGNNTISARANIVAGYDNTISGDDNIVAGIYNDAGGLANNAFVGGYCSCMYSNNAIVVGSYACVSRSDNSAGFGQSLLYCSCNSLVAGGANIEGDNDTYSNPSNYGGTSQKSQNIAISAGKIYGASLASAFGSGVVKADCGFAIGKGSSYGIASFAGGYGCAASYVFAGGKGSFNFSANASFGQDALDNISSNAVGANAPYSAILGGVDNAIAVANTGATIIGGNNITLTGATDYSYNTAVSNLVIDQTPAAGGAEDVLTWNATTGKVNKVTQGSISDGRLKTNLQPISEALEDVSSLNGYEYEFNALVQPESLVGQKRYGLIAQEVENKFPFVVNENVEINGSIYKSVEYRELVPVLVEAIKELKKKNEDLEKRISELE